MHIVAELDRRLEKVKALLKLEEEHLRRVREHGLDDADAQWLIELRRRYLKRLEEQRGVIVHRRLAAHKAQAELAAQSAQALLAEHPRVIAPPAAVESADE
ncbi:hypothetical protein [Dyella sp.]|jgi:DNA repair protein RadC|uniref:hypothetical protein n=1 Tax=Dyella sp. TaxID=1869338 RepID=UPI002D795FD9|nr:hypothetical protein [Dyella sp.]HET6432711.1 hypothetical protein [Dyella sp.]